MPVTLKRILADRAAAIHTLLKALLALARSCRQVTANGYPFGKKLIFIAAWADVCHFSYFSLVCLCFAGFAPIGYLAAATG